MGSRSAPKRGERLNAARIWLGAAAGALAWACWSLFVSHVVLGERYAQAQADGLFRSLPRYRMFVPIWIVTLLLLSYVITWLYASLRAFRGGGLTTALSIGFFVGFAAGFPLSFAMATWAPADRVFPFWWMLELWVGAVIASVLGAALYRDP